MSTQRITIALTNLLIFVGMGLLLVLLWQLRSLLITLMVAVVLAASIAPVVDWGHKLGVSRWIATIVAYLSSIAALMGIALLIGPTALDQIQRLVRQLPTYLETVRLIAEDLAARLNDTPPEFVRQFFDTQSVTRWLLGSSQQLLLRSYGLTRGFVGGVVTLILAIFISGYMLADSRTLIKSLVQLFPKPWDERLEAQVLPVTQRMGGYIRGRLVVSVVLAVATSVGLSFLGLGDFALGLGAIAGLTNLIPFLGPILGAIPALIVALSQGGWVFLWVLILFAIVQNIETYVLDPLLVGSSVGVHPLYQLLSVIGGVQVLGIVGALIVPPWVAGVAALVENLYLKPKLLAEKAEATPEVPPTPSSSMSVPH
ncbi:AI-2E family transporter [Phormidium sp. CCY1219]|jgi:predicted PurR-regulated permease PerM|uniref:AI-2E family transporter n=1 Tax=Phormidium sp. CCY1219 TaxID=2886104 RepID=UPI002D1F384B|nr:AI-2E family transporter [Phormidium sp. CCY1219]MEB3828838.1 AI-2E family transporter [Phormidium sp. CCY1219]